jgi:hypothetical protein
MSTIFSSGSTSTTDVMLAAIMKRRHHGQQAEAAIMKRLDTMDNKLKAIDPLCEKVTSL